MLFIAVVIHGLSAWLQRRFKFYDHLGPMAWNTHQFLIAPAWLLFFTMSSQISRFTVWPMPIYAPEIGWALLAIALFMMVSALKIMDIQVLTNGWLFGVGPRKTHHTGIYKYFKNPFYNGVVLIYVGLAFIGSNAAFLVVAGLLYLLLNHFQARLENIADSLVK